MKRNTTFCQRHIFAKPILKDDAYLIHRKSHPRYNKGIPKHWSEAAQAKGFTLIDRVDNRYNLLLLCRQCGDLLIRPRNVVVDHTPECQNCIRLRRAKAAFKVGAELLSPHPNHRAYGYFKLSCGHIVARQYRRVETAANGGHQLGCDACREQRYEQQAAKFGWSLIGDASSGKPGYRQYQHACGHLQDVSGGNMYWNDGMCAGCGTGPTAQPSYIYVFQIDLPHLPVLKLGYSARPEKRLRQQLGIEKHIHTEILRTVAMPTGHEARAEEEACHRVLKSDAPELIVPKAIFGNQINTQSEIYRAEAAPQIHALLDQIEAKRG
jgi:hypothetical protein